MSLDSKLIIKSINFNRDMVPTFKKYPFNIDVVKNFKQLQFNKPVTFFVGENGIGKSTFIEAIACANGLNPEGGTDNFNFSTKNTVSNLYEYLDVIEYNHPKTKFFLRAESFYNVSTELEKLNEEDGKAFLSYGGKSLHLMSHGESFLQVVKNRFTDHGLYILDEPEAALSPQRQMSLLCMIDELVKEGSQFIIATHSPILISYRDGEIFNLDDNFDKVDYKDTDIYNTYKIYMNDPEEMQRRLFD